MEEAFESGGVRGVLHTPDSPNGDAFALTHGAGSDCNAPLLQVLSRAFAEAGYAVLRYDLPFRQQRPKGPPFPAAAARDREGIVQAVAAVRGIAPGRIYAGGHSYGGRQTAMAAAENPALADALLLLSYPLHPPNRPEQMRTAFFPDLRTPALFVHGTSDPFATLAELRSAMALIPAHTELLDVEGAGHDLKRCAGLHTRVLDRLRALRCSGPV
ncbi:MAG: alpha/beta fold hydrolase [Bryobacteraceae bacterium]|jgi:predicted alpha/beta-hydrolase family hydrolase